MSKAKGQHPKPDRRARVINAALSAAAHEAWEFVSYVDIAQRATMAVDEVCDVFPAKADIIRHIVREMDHEVLKNYKVDARASKRDTLFDVLMERFDAMSEHRAAHASFIKSFGWNHCEKFSDLNFYFSSLENYMRAAEVETRGLKGLANVLALGAGYGWVLYVWMGDRTHDLTKTMAALDKMLGRLEWARDYIRTKS
ncbi:MAG TPA: hypothetical protein PKI93_03900 [Alphaproteobacteria bacterium]|nr:hypothetical protein [Alphaproteobacteria bacterium]HNS43953.1 hypothetical protein [Alphaproteobacteria bacterium]